MSFAGKDTREDAVHPSKTNTSTSAAMLRASLAMRASDATGPATWNAAAAFVGVSGADAFLCHLMRNIACAKETLSSSAEIARVELRSTREALLCAVNSRCDELEAAIGAAETAKACALERELCVVDVALECWRAEHGAVAEAAATLSDPELLTQCTALAARLDAAEALLSSLPTTAIEPPCVRLDMDAPAQIADILGFCRVSAPLPVTAIDLTLAGGADYAHAVSSLQLCLIVRTAQHSLQSDDELGVSLAAAAATTRVEAALESRGAVLQLLHNTITVDIPRRCLVVSFLLPRSAVAGATICVGSVSVYGQNVPSVVVPLRSSVTCTMQPPLILDCSKSDPAASLISWITHTSSRYNYCTRLYGTPLSLCISPSAQIYAPQYANSDVLVFDLDGAVLPDIHVARLGLSRATMWTAFAGGVFPTLLLADYSRLVAVDPTTRELRWKTASGSFQKCSGLAPIPNHGIVVAASHGDLFAHRLSDGVRVGRLELELPCTYLAADPVTGMIFGSTNPCLNCASTRVDRFSWTEVAGLGFEETVAAAGTEWDGCPLAVMPPAPGKRTSHLVVAREYSPELLVLSLPDLSLVHTHRLEGGMDVKGLAADPFGGTLAVSDERSYSIYLLTWPLPGMPPLD